ncbi:uncharacterized protein [Asterias amurensis]|uniref:uncharacterized protein n=1 Tax=Asterias amurensis TaxID=7602 RepID=UPI003AB2B4A7
MDGLWLACLRLTLLVILGLFGTGRTQQIGDLRLVNGPFPNAGRVEMYLGFRGWFTTCDRSWSIDDAIVVCRQLGFPGAALARARSPYGGVVGMPLAREWKCRGDEKRLDDCSYTGKPRCTDAVGVICQGPGYVGCYADFSGNFNSVLRDSYVSTDIMTVSSCRSHCEGINSLLAGLKNGQECYCSKESGVLAPRTKTSDGQCQMPCAGNIDEVCGGGASMVRSSGPDRLTVFDVTLGKCQPGELKNGRALDNEYSFNDVMRFECNAGYHMMNASALRCVMLPDGTGSHVTWNASFPSCQEIIDTQPRMAQGESIAGYDSKDHQYIIVAVMFGVLVLLFSAIIFLFARKKMSARKDERRRITSIRSDPPPNYQDLVLDYEPIADPKTGSYPIQPDQTDNGLYQTLALPPDRPPSYALRVNVPGHPTYPEKLWRHAAKR